mmetsp:Transcript_9757/g.17047  ORF Transcript_9757/g.17047 Transcript_9757/m.17047 type:complete len:737 (-) Transcript_9757:70-2280(-)
MIAAIEWIPAGRANPTPTKYEYSRAERDFLARVTAAQSGEGGGGDLAAPGGGGDAANNGPDAAGSDEEWEVMEQEGGGEGKTKLPKVDLASLPADLRMDEYSDDDDDEDKEKDVGGLLVGKDAEMMGDFQPNNAVEPNNGEGDHDDHDDDSDSEDEDDLADIPDTREYMPLDLKGLQSLGIGGQNYSVEDLQNMTLNNQHDLDNDLDDDEEEEEDEEDANDIKLHDGDALVVVAKTEEDFASLEVNVFDTEGSNLYVHHDIPLPGFPLCLALGSVAPSYQSSFEDSNGGDDEGSSNNAKVGNYVAVGSFEPGIEIWNLDVMNALEPTLVLGGMDTSGAEEDWMRMQNMPTSTNLNSNSNGGGGGKKKKKKKNSNTTEHNMSQNKKDTNNSSTNNAKSNSKNATKPAAQKLKISLPKPSQMSSLQKAFLERLTSSRFRELNEELYTHSSQHSFEHFTKNPELFDQYHVGFRKQVEDWPVNPVDVIYKKILKEYSNEKKKEKGQKGVKGEKGKQVVVADFGCGDAKLAERLVALRVGNDGQTLSQAASKKKKVTNKAQDALCPFKVFSFDLVSGGNPLVTPADMSNVPLPDESVDVGVYSLALMGTNIADFVREAWRVLKFNGVLRVAEVRSRFETAADENKKEGGGGKRAKLNSKLKQSKKPNRKNEDNGADNDSAPQPLMLLDEFISLMERCGFQCNNMDRSNKMFLFMDFNKVDGSKGLSEKERFTAKPCIYKRR